MTDRNRSITHHIPRAVSSRCVGIIALLAGKTGGEVGDFTKNTSLCTNKGQGELCGGCALSVCLACVLCFFCR